MRACLIPCLSVICAIGCGAPATTARRDVPSDPARPIVPVAKGMAVKDLILRLGHEQFSERESATKKLEEIGAPALEQVRKAALESTDPEIRFRCAQLARQIRARVRQDEIARVRLKDDAEYAEKLRVILAQEPKGGTQKAKLLWYLEAATAEANMRHYAEAEKYYRKLIDLLPESEPGFYANLSVYLGKQAKYEDAEAMALKALAMEGVNGLHANMVLASWEWALGKKQAAMDRVKSVPEPEDEDSRSLYHACLACFYAETGNEVKIAEAIRTAMGIKVEDDAGHMEFFRRDAVFDRYRHKQWFIDLVGETLAKEPDNPKPADS
jgi:tetratricopeptide (TPR) repeat protein